MIKVLNDNNFNSMIKEGIKLVFFTAPWCGYCQKQKPVLKEISGKNIWIGEVNGDENPHLTTRFSIHAFPSFIIFKDGKAISQFAGFHSKEEIENKLHGI